MAHRKYGNRCSQKTVAFRRSPAILVNNMMMLQNLQCTSYFVFNLHEIGLSLERPSLAYHCLLGQITQP